MTLELKNRVRGTSATTGTGTYVVLGAPEGFQAFSEMTSGREVYYTVVFGEDWEVGLGTVTVGSSTTLSRDKVLESSNDDAAVSWGVGEKDIFITTPAEALMALYYDGSLRHGDFTGTLKAAGALTAQSGVNVAGSVSGTNTVVGTLTPTIAAYGDQMQVVLIPANTNTGAVTLALNGLTARSVVNMLGQALVAGDLQSGLPALVVYDENNTRWVLVNPVSAARALSRHTIIDDGDSPYTAVAGEDLFVDASGGSVTINLPAAPAITDQPINITQIGGDASAVTIGRNSQRIMGLTEDLVLDEENLSIQLAYAGETPGWRLRIIG